MKILWGRGEAAVGDVQDAIGKDLAYVTVATMLRRMEAQGLVKHRVEGRTFIYKPQVAEDAVTKGMVSDLVNRLFFGSLPALVNHLLSSRDVSQEELSVLEKLIAERKRKSWTLQPSWAFWGNLFGRLALEAGAVVLMAALCHCWIRGAVWRRDIMVRRSVGTHGVAPV